MMTNYLRRMLRLAGLAGLALMGSTAWAGITASQSFSPASIAVGGTSTLTFTISNSPPPGNTGSLSFTQTYPANLVNAPTPAMTNSCGGTATAVAGGNSLSLSGASMSGNKTCTVTVAVTSSVAGSYANSAVVVSTASAGNATAAATTLTVTASPPTVTKSFSPTSISSGGTSTLIITLTNANAFAITGASFTDTYPSTNLKNASPSGVTNSCGGTASGVAGSLVLSLSGGTVPAGGSCSVSVTVTSTIAGSYFNSSGTVTTSNVGSGTASAATLTVSSTAPAGFNAFETSTPGGSVNGVIKTKVAGSAFNLAVVALKSGGTAVETAFTGGVKLELVDASVGGSCAAYGLIQNLGVLSFAAGDLGRKNQTGISEGNAWPNARVRMTYPATGAPTVVACSTDPFAIRPDNLGSPAATDVNSASAGDLRSLANIVATGGNVHKAGRPFQLTATARNTLGATTANYAGTPVPTLVSCILPSTGCVLGGLTASTWTASAGVVKTLDATYSEVGAISMKLVDSTFAAVDAADGSTVLERNIESASFDVGRFVPDHFDLTPASVPVFKTFNDTSCPTRSFTYIGQPFSYVTVPQATITARNAAGATTVNYTGSLWKLDGTGVTPDYSVNPLTHNLVGTIGAATVAPSATTPGTGLLVTAATDSFMFERTVPETEFDADISLSISVGDTSETAVVGNNIIETLTPVVFPTIAFDAGSKMMFGRLQLSNAHGAEMLALPVPIETQVWNGLGFTRNTADFCTQIVAANVELKNWKRNLNPPCETSVSFVPATARFNAGKGNLRMSAPGTANTGSVDLRVHLGAAGGTSCVSGASTAVTGAAKTWLQGKGSGAAWDKDPEARASFGLYRGSKPLIYIREIY